MTLITHVYFGGDVSDPANLHTFDERGGKEIENITNLEISMQAACQTEVGITRFRNNDPADTETFRCMVVVAPPKPVPQCPPEIVEGEFLLSMVVSKMRPNAHETNYQLETRAYQVLPNGGLKQVSGEHYAAGRVIDDVLLTQVDSEEIVEHELRGMMGTFGDSLFGRLFNTITPLRLPEGKQRHLGGVYSSTSAFATGGIVSPYSPIFGGVGPLPGKKKDDEKTEHERMMDFFRGKA